MGECDSQCMVTTVRTTSSVLRKQLNRSTWTDVRMNRVLSVAPPHLGPITYVGATFARIHRRDRIAGRDD